MQKIIKKIGFFLGALIGIILLIFISLVVYFNYIRTRDLSLQAKHLEDLESLYKDNYVPIDESKFSEFAVNDETIHLNEIQLIASHNSYKKLGTELGKFCIGLGDSFEEANLLRYTNDTLSEQFNNGIRSIELDVRYRKGNFEVTHVPLVDNSSTSVNLAMALKEVALWSKNNPNHIPIIILFELKDDWMMLDPALSDITSKELSQLDTLLKDTFKENLLTPNNVIGSSTNLKEYITTNGWPLLKDTLGKVITVLHPGKYTKTYVDLDSDFSSMAMFPAAQNTDINNTYASFIVHNNVDVTTINQLVNCNFIVRTRSDERLKPEPENFQKALDSGAQIITTEFTPGHNFKNVEYVAYLKENYTIIKNTYLGYK